MTLREEIAEALLDDYNIVPRIMDILARRLDPEALARVAWEAASNLALKPGRDLTSTEWDDTWRNKLLPRERDMWRAVATAVIAHVTGEP